MWNESEIGKYKSKSASDNSLPQVPLNQNLKKPEFQQKLEIPKSPRRSSLAIGLLAGRGFTDKESKRRTSVTVAFVGRRENSQIAKETSSFYETIIKTEKSDASSFDPNVLFPTVQIHRDSDNFENEIDENKQSSNKIAKPIEKTVRFFENPSDIESSLKKKSYKNMEKKQFKENVLNSKTEKTAYLKIKSRNARRNSLQPNLGISYKKNRSKSISGSSDLSHEIGIDKHTSKLHTSTSVDNENDEMDNYARIKRNSWWNIFVPNNLKNRSKSRSVDHGLSSPFDLDSLRSKVEGRFDSVDRLSKDEEKAKKSSSCVSTVSYIVSNQDTLTSVAARFDTTPSELMHLNKLTSNFVYPGQQLQVPDKKIKEDLSTNESAETSKAASSKSESNEKDVATEKSSDTEKDILDGLRPGSPKPISSNKIKSGKLTEDDPIITQRFLKINVRHITDGQGVVGGVLLVTPNAIMFDPNVSDTLVIEHGPECYGVIAPMELVVNAAIFHDIAHMRVAGSISDNMSSDSKQNEDIEIYYPKPKKDLALLHEEETPNEKSENINYKPENCVGKIDLVKEEITETVNTENNASQKSLKQMDLEANKGECIEAKDHTKTENQGEQNKLNEKEVLIGNENNEETSGKEKENNLKSSISQQETDKTLLEHPRETIEERRKSLLDQHWAVPSKDRLSLSNSRRSSECHVQQTSTTNNCATAVPDSILAFNRENENFSSFPLLESLKNYSSNPLTENHQQFSATMVSKTFGKDNPTENIDIKNECNATLSQSYYDSGYDIHEFIPVVSPMPRKKVFSDADIVLSSDWVPPRTISPTTAIDDSKSSSQNLQTQENISTDSDGGSGRKKTSSVSFSVEESFDKEKQNDAQIDKNVDQNKKNKMLKRLSYPLTWVEGLAGDSQIKSSHDSLESAPNTGDSNQSVFSKVFSRRSSLGAILRPNSTDSSISAGKIKSQQPPAKLDYRSMVSIDDMPELFVSFDKLIPRPARACHDPPLYLRLRMGKPIGKAIPLPTSVMSYGKNKLRPEYWFSVPKNRVDELYRFITTWVPHLYGELNEEEIKARGFELIQHDTEWYKDNLTKGRKNSNGEEISELTRESWEVVSLGTDDYRKASLFANNSFDLDFPIPDLIGTTEILTEEHREKICSHLPARAEGYSWTLVFSTSQHGFSLNSLYRKMQRLESPVLIVIEDTEHNVFGALTSCALHVSDHFYGTGESLLYKFKPSFKVFHWTGENLYFIKGNPESLSIGAGDGKFGLWLDGDLNQGRSQTCSTYGNEPLAPQEDFVIKTLECWAFV